MAAFAVGETGIANLRSHGVDHKVAAVAAAAAFVVLGTFASRRFAGQLGHVIAARGGRGAGAAVRLVATVVGMVLVIFLTFGLLRIPVSQLLLGGAITGVILGIAAQQSLGNVFSGIVLLVAKPFVVGNRIRIHSGAIGGPFEGEVTSIGLTYVLLDVDGLDMRVPNTQLLGSAVVRLPVKGTIAGRDLYVNRSMPKRPPRSTWQHAGQRRPRGVRRPRELIRRMRARSSATDVGGPGAQEASERSPYRTALRADRPERQEGGGERGPSDGGRSFGGPASH